jgi:hypothetical protein
MTPISRPRGHTTVVAPSEPPASYASRLEYFSDSLALLFLGQADRTWRFLALYGAFWNESGTQEYDTWLSVAGFVSTADRWVEFSAEWLAVLKDCGVLLFHAKDFNARRGEYRDWTDAEALACSVRLVDVIVNHAIGSVGISVPGPVLRQQIPPHLKGQIGHPYAVAARTCIVESRSAA